MTPFVSKHVSMLIKSSSVHSIASEHHFHFVRGNLTSERGKGAIQSEMDSPRFFHDN